MEINSEGSPMAPRFATWLMDAFLIYRSCRGLASEGVRFGEKNCQSFGLERAQEPLAQNRFREMNVGILPTRCLRCLQNYFHPSI